MEQVVIIFGIIMAVYGAMDLFGRLAFWILYPKKRFRYLVMPLCGKNEDVEYTARCLAAERDMFLSSNEEIVLADFGMDEESRNVATRVCHELGLLFCNGEKLEEILAFRLQEREGVV